MKKLYTAILAGAAMMMATSAHASLYLIGAPQGWNIESGAMELTETSTGVYEGQFNISSNDFMFRFYTSLGDWETNSIGSQVDDDPIDITLTDNTWYTGKAVAGKGSWSYPYWKGGDLFIRVNTNTMTVVFTSDPNTIDDIPVPAPDMFIRGANINGVSAWDGSPAMSYNYTDKVYEWTGTTLGSNFKFSDSLGWDGQYNIGSNGKPVEIGVPYSYYNGGDSGNIKFASDNEVVNNPKVVLDLNAGTLLITGNSEEQEISLTIAGTFNDWNGDDADYKLTKTSNGNFEGTFYMFPSSSFQVVLLNNTWYGYASGNGEIYLNNTGSATVDLGTGYQNDFLLADWTGGNLTFTVTMQGNTPKTLTISSDNSGIDSVITSEEAKSVFNLQGVRVDSNKLNKGIYIINGKKVMVK